MKYIIFILYVFVCQLAYSQWEKTSWKSDAEIRKCFISENVIIFSVVNDGLIISNDTGNTWRALEGLPKDIAPNAITVNGISIFIGGFGYLYVSTNLGNNWQLKINGLPSFPIVKSFVQIDSIVFAATADGVFVTTDNGNIWVARNNGLGNNLSINTLVILDKNIYACTGSNSGVYLSTNLGLSWELKSRGLPLNRLFNQITISNNSIYIGDQNDPFNGFDNEVFISNDYGDSWELLTTTFLHRINEFSIASIGSKIFISAGDSTYFSPDKGLSWINKTNDLPAQLQQGISSFFTVDNNIYVSSGSVLYFSSNFGATWTSIHNSLNFGGVYTLASIGNIIFAGASPSGKMTSYQNGIFASSDLGKTWEPKGLINTDVLSITINGNLIYAITNKGNFISSDYGMSWLDKNNGFPDSSSIFSLAFDYDIIYAAVGEEGIKVSTNNGIDWVDKNVGLPIPFQKVLSISTNGNEVFAGFDSTFFISRDKGNSWQEKIIGLPKSDLMIKQIEIKNGKLYIVTKYGIYYSPNYAESWEKISNTLPDYSMNNDSYNCKIVFYNNNIFTIIQTVDGGVFLSTNNGNSWVQKNTGISNIDLALSSITINGDYIFVGTNSGRFGYQGDGIFRAKLSDFGIISVTENLEKQYFSLFPNPVSDYLNLSFPNTNSSVIIIYNELGIPVFEKKVQNENNLKIDTRDYPPGIYFCQIKAGSYSETKKFVVVK